MSGCEQHHHCSVRSCTPTVQQLAPIDSQQSGSEITQAVGRSQKKGDPRAGRVLYATARILSSPLASDILSFCRQHSPAIGVDVTFKTGKERRDQHQEPNVVQFKSPAKHGRLTISSWERRALEDERSCRRVYFQAVRLMRAAVACMYITYVCNRPTKAAAGLARRVSRFPQRHAANRSRSSTDNGSCRIGISVDMG
jgi:hypothetical protein